MAKTNIAILASGNGTNAQNIIRYFKNHRHIKVSLVVSNNENAKVISRAERKKVPAVIIKNDKWKDAKYVSKTFDNYNIHFVVLAGFLILVPQFLIKKYKDRIINIHPALLPEYGGEGMYGEKVHQAVIDDGKKESGLTIHRVNEKYDEGNIIFQAKCEIPKNKSPKSLANRIHKLEHEYYPKVIECLIENKIK